VGADLGFGLACLHLPFKRQASERLLGLERIQSRNHFLGWQVHGEDFIARSGSEFLQLAKRLFPANHGRAPKHSTIWKFLEDVVRSIHDNTTPIPQPDATTSEEQKKDG